MRTPGPIRTQPDPVDGRLSRVLCRQLPTTPVRASQAVSTQEDKNETGPDADPKKLHVEIPTFIPT